MLISSAFPGKYLKSEDLMGDTLTVTIKAVSLEPVGITNERLPVCYFKEFQKGMVLNKTNGKTIASLFGDETNQWRGKQIVLYEAMVEFQGDVMPALRVRSSQNQVRGTPMDQMPNGTSGREDVLARPLTERMEGWDQPVADNPQPYILAVGEEIAKQGITAFRSWRDGLDAVDMDTIRPFLERLTATAKYVDDLTVAEGKPRRKSKTADNQVD